VGRAPWDSGIAQWLGQCGELSMHRSRVLKGGKGSDNERYFN